MATKLIRPTNGVPDNRYLERDELERELTRHNRQTLIDDCLKIFDTNTILFEQVERLKEEKKALTLDAVEAIKERRRLERRTLWQILNERIAWRIEKIRKRRTETNYPTP